MIQNRIYENNFKQQVFDMHNDLTIYVLTLIIDLSWFIEQNRCEQASGEIYTRVDPVVPFVSISNTRNCLKKMILCPVTDGWWLDK